MQGKPVYSGVITQECLGCGQSAALGLLPGGGPPPLFFKDTEREREVVSKRVSLQPNSAAYFVMRI